MILQVGVKLLIRNDDGRYLFLRRSSSFKPGIQKWDIPGGRIEPHEALIDGLRRELFEETSLKLDGIKSLLAAQDIFVDDKNVHVIRLTYLGSAIEGNVVLSDEHDTYKWMTKQELLTEAVDSYITAIQDKF